jgi:biopolymer transport protein ExbD
MRRRHHYRRRGAAQNDLDMTTFLNLMVVLVPFLLVTAVFSRITVVELRVPSSAGGEAPDDTALRLEVIVRQEALEIAAGDALIARLPKVDDAYDLDKLTEHAIALKRQHPDEDGASVLLEPDIEYDHLIQVMDAVRSADVSVDGSEESARVALFTNISIGDAP